MGINLIPLFIVGAGCICVIYYGYKNIKDIKTRNIPKKEQRRINKKKRAKEKYG